MIDVLGSLYRKYYFTLTVTAEDVLGTRTGDTYLVPGVPQTAVPVYWDFKVLTTSTDILQWKDDGVNAIAAAGYATLESGDSFDDKFFMNTPHMRSLRVRQAAAGNAILSGYVICRLLAA